MSETHEERIPKALSSGPPGGSAASEGALLAMYAALTTRRATFDTLMWQVPVLGLTAQAFLLTIALGHDSSRSARLIAGVLAFLIAAISMQTMQKWRQSEVVDSKLIERLETEHLHVSQVLGVPPHARLVHRAQIADQKLARLAKRSSYRLWVSALALFAGAALTVVGATLAHAGLF